MSDFFICYLFSNLVCLSIFGLFLYHDRRGVDRQEKQIIGAEEAHDAARE